MSPGEGCQPEAGARATGTFRFCHDLSGSRLAAKCVVLYIGLFLLFAPVIAGVSFLLESIVSFLLSTAIQPEFLFWWVFLVAFHGMYLAAAISFSNSEYDECFCDRCHHAWSVEAETTMREEDTDEAGIPLLNGRTMVYSTTVLTCMCCGNRLEEIATDVRDPAMESGGE